MASTFPVVVGTIAALFCGAGACAEQSISAKNLYVVLLRAERESPNQAIRPEDKQSPIRELMDKARCIIATSEEEAERRAIGELKQQYPYENGWYNYVAKVAIVPKEVVDSLR